MIFSCVMPFKRKKKKNSGFIAATLYIKYIYLRDSFVCPRQIFIFDSDQAQINSVPVNYSPLDELVSDAGTTMDAYSVSLNPQFMPA
jgi:hypothetical protein